MNSYERRYNELTSTSEFHDLGLAADVAHVTLGLMSRPDVLAGLLKPVLTEASDPTTVAVEALSWIAGEIIEPLLEQIKAYDLPEYVRLHQSYLRQAKAALDGFDTVPGGAV